MFKLGAGQHVAALPKTQVRAPASKAVAFKGAERRAVAATARPKPAAAKPAAPKAAPAKAAVSLPQPAKAVAASGGDDEWETF